MMNGKAFSDNILICDDDVEFIRFMLESVIGSDDRYILEHIILCESVDEALEKYILCRPFVVLMDIRMPEKSGIDGARMLREIDPNARIFFLSNFPHDPAAAKAVSEHLAMGVLDKGGGTGFIASILGFIIKVAMKVT